MGDSNLLPFSATTAIYLRLHCPWLWRQQIRWCHLPKYTASHSRRP